MTTMKRINDEALSAVDKAIAHAVARRTRLLSARVDAAEAALRSCEERLRALATRVVEDDDMGGDLLKGTADLARSALRGPGEGTTAPSTRRGKGAKTP